MLRLPISVPQKVTVERYGYEKKNHQCKKNSGHSLAPNRDRESPSGFLPLVVAPLCGGTFSCSDTPLMRSGFFITDDGEWMIIRLSAFYQSLADGQFPVRFLGRLNNSYGYPVSNFLYPGFLYLGSLLHILGASFSGCGKNYPCRFRYLGRYCRLRGTSENIRKMGTDHGGN